jgi:DNA-directed RNA polymerase alpha subunit
LTSSFNVYPNPVNDKLYIETLTQTQTLTVEIYDVYGRQQSMVNGQQSTVIDVTSLNSGVYFVKVVTENGEAVRRFIKK